MYSQDPKEAHFKLVSRDNEKLPRRNLSFPICRNRSQEPKSIFKKIHGGAEDLRSHLRQGRVTRHKRASKKGKRGVFSNRHFIDESPGIVEEKTRIGDWEGDTIEGAKKKGYVGTFVDRTTKYLIAFPLKNKTALELRRNAFKAFSALPKEYRKTITLDNGKEFSEHERLSKALDTQIFFAHPYHSWERGLNEHTNGLLRLYLPKKMRLDYLTQKQRAVYVEKINNRPRKSLGYRTPRELFLHVPAEAFQLCKPRAKVSTSWLTRSLCHFKYKP